VFSRQTLDQFRTRLRSGGQPGWSAFGGAAGATVHPSGPHPDARAALNSQRGLLMAIADVGGELPASQSLMEQIIKAYEEVPPDVDRLIALRATLDKANRVLKGPSKGTEAPARAPMVIAAVVGNQWYGIGAGAIRCYCIQASGRIDAIRMEPTAQRKLEPEDSLLVCTSSVSEKLDEYDIALTVYSRSPQSAVQRLLAMAKEKGAQGALGAIVFGPQRSFVTSIFGRSFNK
jgi:hypothetical protein